MAKKEYVDGKSNSKADFDMHKFFPVTVNVKMSTYVCKKEPLNYKIFLPYVSICHPKVRQV